MNNEPDNAGMASEGAPTRELPWPAALEGRSLIIASHRGPVSLQQNSRNELEITHNSGGLVTALSRLAAGLEATWIATAASPTDASWKEGVLPLEPTGAQARVQFIDPPEDALDGYYNVISNPLLWFLQHNMWDLYKEPTIDLSTWRAWDRGYTHVNRQFAQTIAARVRQQRVPPLVMLQDYQLYLVPGMLREALRGRRRYTLTHFVHIPWPGSEDWGILPAGMRQPILESLCSVDLLGFQVRDDTVNFLRTCETYLPRAEVSYRRRRIWFRNHFTYVRDFPISIDVVGLGEMSTSSQVLEYRERLQELAAGRQVILRVDRTDPSKNILRGFLAYRELLEQFPEHREQVVFMAMLVPSRLGVPQYQSYLDDIQDLAQQINAEFGKDHWQPILLFLGEDYPRAVAAESLYDVLLANSIADGMNLVAKEGPIVNQKDGVLILSQRTGARQELDPGAISISPVDVFATTQALHLALTMPADEKRQRASLLRWIIEHHTVFDWFSDQMETILNLGLLRPPAQGRGRSKERA